MMAGGRCTKFSSKAKSSPPAISICAGSRRTSPARPTESIEPFIQVLADKGILPVGKVLEDAVATNRAALICRWTTTTWIWNWRAVSRRDLPALVYPAIRPDEQIHSGRDGQPVQPAGGQRTGRGHPNRLLWYLVVPDRTGQEAPQSLSVNFRHASRQNIWRTNRRRPGRRRPAERQAGRGTARAAEEGRHPPAQADPGEGLRQRAGHGGLAWAAS